MKGILIGDPVEQSIGDRTHNKLFQIHGISAIYEKRKVPPELFHSMMEEIKKSGYDWIAVTMPYKEAILPLIDHLTPDAAKIGSVNTILLKNGLWIGYNTDGVGALEALEKHGSVAGKRIVVLGAGGTARALAFEAKKRGGDVVLWNRTIARAEKIGCDLDVAVVSKVPHDYDILVNTTSLGMKPQDRLMPILKEQIRSDAIIMDVIYSPQKTHLLKTAEAMGCTIVTGGELFAELSFLQFSYLFGDSISKQSVYFSVHEELTKS